MEDVITDAPPPSRFFKEELNNFTPPSLPLPSPFVLFSNPKPEKPLRPELLLIAISSPSLFLFHNISSKTLIGSLILPEIPFAGNTLEPSLGDKSCNIYSLNNDNSTLLVAFQFSVPAERAHPTAKLLIDNQIIPDRVLILDSIQSRNFRGKLPPDDSLFFKLETLAERNNSKTTCSNLLKGINYFPSGSIIDGLSAALLSRCQIRNIKATLGLSWPESGPSATSLIKSALMTALPNLKTNEEASGKAAHMNNSELYT
ncbi:unnamed protein product [Rhodiola kirilowii]